MEIRKNKGYIQENLNLLMGLKYKVHSKEKNRKSA
jgi:hypothetical protein